MAKKHKHLTRDQLIVEVARHYLKASRDMLKERAKDGEEDAKDSLKDADRLNDQAAHMFYEDRCFQLDVEDMMETLSHKYVK